MERDRRGPFDRLRPAAAVAGLYAVLAAVWVAFGADLPGGRWLAVHLFTLGVVTNLILALSDHFARALTRQPGEAPLAQLLVVNAGMIGVLLGVSTGRPVWTAAGASVVALAVTASAVRLRRLRRAAIGPRFGWVVRTYEVAHAAFLLGALFGALVGTGVAADGWVAALRIAHLHVNLLGWAGLTLLATVVFFGPTIARTRIREGADVRAARAVRVAAGGLALAVVALVATGIGGEVEPMARATAAAGLLAFAWSVAAVAIPVVRASASANAPERWSILAVGVWFVVVAWADALVVGFGAWPLLDAVGGAMLLGVLAQAILTSVGYLAPRLLHLDPATAFARTEAWAATRAVAWNVGVVLVVGSAVAALADGAPVVSSVGWGLILGAIALRVVLVARAAFGAERPHRDAAP